MADKEKRILITKCSSHCHALRVSCDPFDDDDGMYCDKSGKWVRITEKDCAKCKDPVLLGLSRSEVIEKIAKAICRTDGGDCEDCDFKGNKKGCKKYLEIGNYITQAEVVLEDLLDGHDDEK